MPEPIDAGQRRATIVLAATLFAAAAYVVHGLAASVAWAAVIAIGLDPLRRRLIERTPGRRDLVAGGLVAVVALVVLAPLAIALTQASKEAGDVAAWIARARVEGVPVPAWVGSVPLQSDRIASWWRSELSDPAAVTRRLDAVHVADIAHRYQHVGIDALHRMLGFAFIVLSLFFMLRGRDAIVGQMRRASLRAFGEAGPRIGTLVLSSVRGTIDGVVLVGLAQGAVMGVVFLIAGVPHPVVFGLVAGIGAMVPLGIGVVSVAAAFLVLVGGSPGWACAVVLIALAVHFVAEHFFKPALIGGSTSLPFLLVLLGLVGGLETIGLLGLFIGPAVMAATAMLWREYVAEHPAADPERA